VQNELSWDPLRIGPYGSSGYTLVAFGDTGIVGHSWESQAVGTHAGTQEISSFCSLRFAFGVAPFVFETTLVIVSGSSAFCLAFSLAPQLSALCFIQAQGLRALCFSLWHTLCFALEERRSLQCFSCLLGLDACDIGVSGLVFGVSGLVFGVSGASKIRPSLALTFGNS